MIQISDWMHIFFQKLIQTFGDRVWFVGLQGSYGRGEATDTSDIDVVVILDELTVNDLRVYNEMIDSLPHREQICGFLSGKQEILNWEPSDLFQFYHDTNPIFGSLDDLLPLLDSDAVDRAIKIGACNIYHGCVHNFLHVQSDDVLRGLYKSASFVLQAIAYKQTDIYIRRQEDLLSVLSPDEQCIVNTLLHLKRGGKVKFASMSETLFRWSQKWISGDEKKCLQ
jgi:predicted nucleotidyltransferase